MKKRTLLYSLLMALVMMAISPQSTWALGGSGTSGSPYTIANAADLIAFAGKVNGSEQGAYAKLTADITLTSAWTAMGTSSKPYTGTFDGQGHKISGLSLTATAANAGLFGYVNGATIKNFSLAGSVSSNSDNVGSVVGSAKGSTTIQNIVSTVNITMSAAKSHLGGIAGNIENGTSVLGCTYSGTLNAGSSTDSNGGIVGFANANCSGTIKYCFFNGTVKTTGSGSQMGGILGYTNDESNNFGGVQNCYSCGTLDFTGSDKYANAIVGHIRAKSHTTINNTFLSGTATRACNEDCAERVDFTKNYAITISVTAGSNGTVSHSYVNPTSTTATQLEVVATPNAHYHFRSWSDSGAQTHNVGLTANVSLSASFAIDQHTISVATNNANYGTVSGGGTFDYGTTNVRITATPKAHYHFVKWNDGNTNASRQITVTEDMTYTATFAIDQHTITVKTNDGNMGTVSGGGKYDYNTLQTITATPKAHYHFVQWNDGVKTASRQITVTEDKTYTATFAIDQHTITVKANDANMGTVSGGGTFDYNSTKTITATPKEHYHFVQWNDGNTNASRQITVNGNATYTATFAIDQHTITVATNDANMGTVSGGGTYDYNSDQTITATPKEHYHFVEWNDGNTDASRQITVNGNATYTATFAIDQHTITVATNDANMGTVSGGGTFDYNSTKTIIATPKEHYHFVQWNDGNTDASRTITVTDDAQQNTYTATFAIDQHTIALNVNNSNMGTVTGSGTFDYNSQQVITATPNTGCDFIGWSDGVKDATRQITVTDDAQQNTYTANFIQARAILTDGTLTFYYDGIDHDGTAYPLNTGADRPGWHEKNSNITTVVFDASFASMRPTSCAFWFDDCKNLSSITGIEYLNTERVTTMEYMFHGCWVLSSLDVTGFNTEQVTDMESMFYGCKKLTSLNLSSFNTANVGNMSYMFSNCRELSELTIGNFDMQSVFYAYRMFYDPETYLSLSALNTLTLKSLPFLADGTFNTQFTGDGKEVNIELHDNSIVYTGDTNYLPEITSCNHFRQEENDFCIYCHRDLRTPKVVFADNTLTFYYDIANHAGGGEVYKLNTGGYPRWYDKRDNITTVVFDESFKDARPTTCYCWFRDFNYLKDITGLQHLNTSEVWNMAFMFENCYSLTSLDVSRFNTANVTNMASMFENCNSLTLLDVSNFNTENVMYMNGMFNLCENLSTLDLSSFNTANVTEMIGMFKNCPRLKNLIIDRFNMQNVTDYDDMFFRSLNLTTLTLKSLPYLADGTFNTFFNNKTVNLELSANSFIYDINEVNHLPKITNCNHYGSPVDHYAHVDPTCTQDGYEGYECIYCKNAISITTHYPNLGGHKPGDDGVCTVCHAEQKALAVFNDCTLTFCKDFEENNRGFVFQLNDDNQMPDWLYLAEEIKSVVFEASFQNARPTSCYDWFSNCTNIETITGLEYLNTSEVTNMNEMFHGCSSLQSLDLRNFNTANVTDMGAMFFGCSSLQSLNLSKFNTANVTNMNQMFHGCSSLQSLDLSSFNTAKVAGMLTMFAECNNLTRLDLSSFNTVKVEDMSGMFHGCSSLQSLDLGNFNTEDVMYMDNMFADCSSLQSLDLSSFNTANVTGMGGMFIGCSSLESLDLGNFNTENVMYMNLMFADCSSLQSLDLSSFNIANVWSMAEMFDGCSSLQSLKLSNDFVLGDDCDTSTMFLDCGNAENKCQIYYALGDDLRNKLREGTEFDSNRMEFVESAIVKDGVPFNISDGSHEIPAENVAFTRTFTPEKPASAMLPFTVEDANQISGAAFYEFKGVKYENGEWVATMQAASTVEAYKPYVVIREGAGEFTFGSGYQTVTFPVTPAASDMTQTDPETGWTFVALNEFKRWEAGDDEIGKAYGFAGKNKDYDDYSVAQGEFVKIAAGASAKPGRCYLIKEGALAAKGMTRADDELPSTIKVRFINGDSDVNGIAELNTETGEMSDVKWYDLNGRRIVKPTKGGIYIKNNKKVLVK